MNNVISYLLTSSPWVAYRTRVDLLDQSEDHPEVQKIREEMLVHPQIRGLINSLSHGLEVVLNSHKNARHPLHIMTFLADIGCRMGDERIDGLVHQILEHQSTQGPFQVLMNIPQHFGGSGKDEWAWALCDAPLVIYSLMKFGLKNDERIQKGIDFLVNLIRENGWPCTVSPELGRFRGPGRKEDPCPYATLVMLKMLSQSDEYKPSESARIGCNALFHLWEKSLDVHPYLFYMGTDFRKLKAPLIWYDILHVLDVLSQFPWVHQDERFLDMLRLVTVKKDERGHYTPESIWKAWKEWDFGQKKHPSPWLTYLVLNIEKRLGKKFDLLDGYASS